MKDAVVVIPVLLAGAFGLAGLAEAPHHAPSRVSDYMLFLAFLAGVLLVWYRMKQGAAERLRALELGREFPAPAANPWRAAVVMVAGTPIALMLIAWFASHSSPQGGSTLFTTAMMLGLSSVICGTALLSRQATTLPASSTKPVVYDPDAIDHVARRG